MKKALLVAGMLSVSSTAFAADWLGAANALLGEESASTSAEAAAPATAQAIDFAAGLAPALTESLGVSSEQASGGLGALFGLAKDNLSSGDFSTLSKSVPGMDSLLSAAPEVAGASDGLGGLMSGAGKYGKAMTGAKEVYEQFSALGLDPAQVGQYMNITTSYLQSEGGQAAVDIFKDGVSALLAN